MTQTVTFRGIVFAAVMGVAMAAAGAAESSWYVVGKAGQSGVDERYGTPGSGGWGVDGEELSGGIEVGWAFHENLAVQGGYHFLGDYASFGTGQPCTEDCPLALLLPADFPSGAQFQGVSLSVVPRWAANERFAVHGKLGVLDWDTDLSFDFGPEQAVVTPSGEDLLAGAGLEYGWPGGAGLLLEYEHAGPFDVVSLGGTWRF